METIIKNIAIEQVEYGITPFRLFNKVENIILNKIDGNIKTKHLLKPDFVTTLHIYEKFLNIFNSEYIVNIYVNNGYEVTEVPEKIKKALKTLVSQGYENTDILALNQEILPNDIYILLAEYVNNNRTINELGIVEILSKIRK